MSGLNGLNEPFVYRLLRPDENPNQDIRCKDRYSNLNISNHIEFGLRDPSRFISTSTRLSRTIQWINKARLKCLPKFNALGNRTTIIKINIDYIKQNYPRIANSAYDFTDMRNRDLYLKNDRQISFAKSYSEVVFEDWIPKEAIDDIYKVPGGWLSEQSSQVELSQGNVELVCPVEGITIPETSVLDIQERKIQPKIKIQLHRSPRIALKRLQIGKCPVKGELRRSTRIRSTPRRYLV